MYMSPSAPKQLNLGAKLLKGTISAYNQSFAADETSGPPQWAEMMMWLVPAYDVRCYG
jgi:hypothetical protein